MNYIDMTCLGRLSYLLRDHSLLSFLLCPSLTSCLTEAEAGQVNQKTPLPNAEYLYRAMSDAGVYMMLYRLSRG